MQTARWMRDATIAAAAASACWLVHAEGLKPPSDTMPWARWQARLALGTTPAPQWRSGADLQDHRLSSGIGSASLMGDYYFSRSLAAGGIASGFRATSGLIVGPRTALWTARPNGMTVGSPLQVERRLFDLHAIVRRSLGRRVFRWNMEALYALAGRFTDSLANGSLQRSLLCLVLAAAAAGAAPFVGGDASPLQWRAPQPMPLLGWLLWLVLVACTAWTIRLYRQRLLALHPYELPEVIAVDVALGHAPYLDWIGQRWWALPNPLYGSWEPALFNNAWSQPAGERRAQKEAALDDAR